MTAEPLVPSPPPPVRPDDALVDALCAGDERAFVELVERLTPGMLRVARCHVPNQAVAEEVVQETWVVVLTRLGAFQRRSSLTTWVFGILLNTARTSGRRERRCTPVDLQGPDDGGSPLALADDARRVRRRVPPPRRWGSDPEDVLMARETLHRVRAALDDLPPRQREVVELHDVVGLPAADVCALLGLSPGNQRVLLHRGRTRVRSALEEYLGAAG
ncbi:RNA polymerase sigma factor [Geodermatophilus sp. DSM 44513]|uniref:RNA polymerase sigma factor n=1 Tax=Geodermatophilus sp. DSM 44513 TaxID=1528104 RepID=UPI001279CC9C|nr:RNA polymerase sigma factor [Geodermatophilus sp. DSM 44513]WNV73963.1 RNA polymerase sigma factor [Geodermatophilus sp. DSM 44513]